MTVPPFARSVARETAVVLVAALVAAFVLYQVPAARRYIAGSRQP